jgi:hypothetical protein
MSVTLPLPLLEAIQSRTCVPFVGSRLSAMAGSPTWGELIQSLSLAAQGLPFTGRSAARKAKGAQASQGLPDPDDYLKEAQRAEATLGPYQYARVLQEQLRDRMERSSTHEAFEAIAATDYRGIVTTNYDRYIETAVTLHRRWTPPTFTCESLSSFATSLSPPEFFVFKLHGDLESPTSIVLTVHDYERLVYRDPYVGSFIREIYRNNTVLLIGYRLRDPDLHLIMRGLAPILQEDVRSVYALTSSSDAAEQSQLPGGSQINLIGMDPDNESGELIDALKSIQQLAPF